MKQLFALAILMLVTAGVGAAPNYCTQGPCNSSPVIYTGTNSPRCQTILTDEFPTLAVGAYDTDSCSPSYAFPCSDSVTYAWWVDGVTTGTLVGTTDTFPNYPLAAGEHTITCRIDDVGTGGKDDAWVDQEFSVRVISETPSSYTTGAYSIQLTMQAGPPGYVEVYTDSAHTKKWYAYTQQSGDGMLDAVTVPLEGGEITVKSLAAATTYYLRVVYPADGLCAAVHVDFPPISTQAQNVASEIPLDPTAVQTFGIGSSGLGIGDQFSSEGSVATIVRAEMPWNDSSEPDEGEYYFDDAGPSTLHTAHEYIAGILNAGLTAHILLDYGNWLYDGASVGITSNDGTIPTWPLGKEVPYTNAYRLAYAKWAAAEVNYWTNTFEPNPQHPDAKIIWELWNEPGCNPKMYVPFFATAVAFMRQVDPQATIIGPAYAGVSLSDMEGVMQMCQTRVEGSREYPSLLSLSDGISFHPYRPEQPEQADADFAGIYALLDRYSPNRQVPLIVTEWGYPTRTDLGGYQTDGYVTPTQQAQFLVRQRLFDLSRQIGFNTWFEYRDNAPDANYQGPFGLKDYAGNDRLSYLAATTVIDQLRGFKFQCMLPANANEQKMLFWNDSTNTWKEVAWTTDGTVHTPTYPAIPVVPIGSNVMGVVGLRNESNWTSSSINGSPRYITLVPMVRATWSWLKPWDYIGVGTTSLTLRNVSGVSGTFTVQVTIDGGTAQVSPSSIELTNIGSVGTFLVTVSQAPTAPKSMAHVSVRVDGNPIPGYGDVPVLVRSSLKATASNLVWIQTPPSPYAAGWYANVRLEANGQGVPAYSRYHFTLSGSVNVQDVEAFSISGTDGAWVYTGLPQTPAPTTYDYSVHVLDTLANNAEVAATPDLTYHGESTISFTQVTQPNLPTPGQFNAYRAVDPFNGYWENQPHQFQETVFTYPSVFQGSSQLTLRQDPSGIFDNVLHADGTYHLDNFWGAATHTVQGHRPYVLGANDLVPEVIGMWVRGAGPTEGPVPDLTSISLSVEDSNANRQKRDSQGNIMYDTLGNPLPDPVLWQVTADRSVTWTGWRWITINLNNTYAPIAEGQKDAQGQLTWRPNTVMVPPVKWVYPVVFSNWDKTILDVTYITPIDDNTAFPTIPANEPVTATWDTVNNSGVIVSMPLGSDSSGELPTRTLSVYSGLTPPAISTGNPGVPDQIIHHLGQADSITVTGLDSEVTYYFVVTYKNRNGYSTYSNIASCTTP